MSTGSPVVSKRVFSGPEAPVQLYTSGRVVRLAPTATVAEAAALLSAHDVGALVVAEGDTVVGIVSERDVAHAVASRIPLDTLGLGEVASTKLVWCSPNESVATVSARMLEHYVRHVLVREGHRIVGVVSARDLVGAHLA
ncbi:MAG: CBS domain-containing protein [Acidimicrobiia bacterium]|nr:CBS domain-containing protein [Acidimicrobiia bacterium]